MLVKEVLKSKTGDLRTVSSPTPVVDAMKILIENKIGCLPVVDKTGQLQGIISDKDIFRSVYDNHDGFASKTVADLMTTDVIIGVPDDDMHYIAGLMTKNYIRHIPIMEDRKMIGLISSGDVVKAQMKHIEIENRYLKMYIDGTHLG